MSRRLNSKHLLIVLVGFVILGVMIIAPFFIKPYLNIEEFGFFSWLLLEMLVICACMIAALVIALLVGLGMTIYEYIYSEN